MNTKYCEEQGKLVIRDHTTNAIRWQGDFDAPVYKVLPLELEDGCLVLLDPGGSKKSAFENLFFVDSSGKTRWRAQLPDPHGAFTDILLGKDGIEASTWYGTRVRVDVATGRTSRIGFGK